MPRLPYSTFEDKNFGAVGKPTINVMKMLGHSSSTAQHWCDVGAAQFARLELSKKHRELVILLSSAKFKSTYEWTHHIPLSSRFGITDKQRQELAQAGEVKGYFSKRSWDNEVGFNDKEKTLLEFLETVIDLGEVDEELWKQVTGVFSEREIVEIVSMQGFYYTFSRITTVLKVELDELPQPKI